MSGISLLSAFSTMTFIKGKEIRKFVIIPEAQHNTKNSKREVLNQDIQIIILSF